MPLRGDFDTEWDDEAELLISDLSISLQDTSEETDLKTRLLELYNQRLKTREAVKQFLFENRLLDFDTHKTSDRRTTRDEKELSARLRIFAHLLSPEQYTAFTSSVLAKYRLSRDLHRHTMARAVGARTKPEVDFYEFERRMRATRLAPKPKPRQPQPDAQHPTPPEKTAPTSTELRRAREAKRVQKSVYPQVEAMPIQHLQDVHMLTLSEKKLCSALHIPPVEFLRLRDSMLYASEQELGRADRKQAVILKLRAVRKDADAINVAQVEQRKTLRQDDERCRTRREVAKRGAYRVRTTLSRATVNMQNILDTAIAGTAALTAAPTNVKMSTVRVERVQTRSVSKAANAAMQPPASGLEQLARGMCHRTALTTKHSVSGTTTGVNQNTILPPNALDPPASTANRSVVNSLAVHFYEPHLKKVDNEETLQRFILGIVEERIEAAISTCPGQPMQQPRLRLTLKGSMGQNVEPNAPVVPNDHRSVEKSQTADKAQDARDKVEKERGPDLMEVDSQPEKTNEITFQPAKKVRIDEKPPSFAPSGGTQPQPKTLILQQMEKPDCSTASNGKNNDAPRRRRKRSINISEDEFSSSDELAQDKASKTNGEPDLLNKSQASLAPPDEDQKENQSLANAILGKRRRQEDELDNDNQATQKELITARSAHDLVEIAGGDATQNAAQHPENDAAKIVINSGDCSENVKKLAKRDTAEKSTPATQKELRDGDSKVDAAMDHGGTVEEYVLDEGVLDPPRKDTPSSYVVLAAQQSDASSDYLEIRGAPKQPSQDDNPEHLTNRADSHQQEHNNKASPSEASASGSDVDFRVESQELMSSGEENGSDIVSNVPDVQRDRVTPTRRSTRIKKKIQLGEESPEQVVKTRKRTKRGRGRPPGSKSAKKDAVLTSNPDSDKGLANSSGNYEAQKRPITSATQTPDDATQEDKGSTRKRPEPKTPTKSRYGGNRYSFRNRS